MDGQAPRGPPGQPQIVDASHFPPGTSIVVQQQQQQGGGKAPPRNAFDQTWAAALVLFLAPFLAWMFFFVGVNAIDDPTPDVDAATAAHSAVAFIGFAALAWTVAAGPARVWRPLLYGLPGFVFTWWVAEGTLRAWDGEGAFGLIFLAVLGFVAIGVLGGLWGWRLGHGDASDMAGAATVGWTLPLAVVSMVAISTAQSRAIEAERYYQETPGVGLVLLLVGLLALAWIRRING